MDLLPGELRERAAERLVENLERHDFHLTTGFVGVGLLCPTLSEMGYGDVAHRLLRNETFPSWGYSIRHGATTIWERWDGWTDTDGFQTPKMNSFNHYSLGSVGQWLYEYVGGIRAAAPGYERVLIAPEPGELEWARVEYRSVRGTISSAWRREGDELHARGRDPAQRHRHRRRPGRRDRRGRVRAARLHGGGEPGGLSARGTVHHVVNDPFKALSHPIRRGIVERLAAGPATVGDATSGFGVSKPAISKHLKVLEETGVVTRVIEGRTHRLSLDTHAMSEAADWMDRQRALWGRLFDVVDEYLKEDKPQ